jgi:hypothetical protein
MHIWYIFLTLHFSHRRYIYIAPYCQTAHSASLRLIHYDWNYIWCNLTQVRIDGTTPAWDCVRFWTRTSWEEVFSSLSKYYFLIVAMSMHGALTLKFSLRLSIDITPTYDTNLFQWSMFSDWLLCRLNLSMVMCKKFECFTVIC